MKWENASEKEKDAYIEGYNAGQFYALKVSILAVAVLAGAAFVLLIIPK